MPLNEAAFLKAVPQLLPPLTGLLAASGQLLRDVDVNYKGDMGRVAVVGGCREYAGAPYFAAMAALRVPPSISIRWNDHQVGADLSHVFTTAAAAPIIKTYSPELIVHDCLQESSTVQPTVDEMEAAEKLTLEEMRLWLDRLDGVVIGPGLGRNPVMQRCIKIVFEEIKRRNVPIVVDADALYLVSKDRSMIQDYPHSILTPNINELRRLASGLDIPYHHLSPDEDDARETLTHAVARQLNGPTIISKGRIDFIAQSDQHLSCSVASSPRRCGGQGDVLSGVAGVFATWSRRIQFATPLLLAAFGACVVTRRSAQAAFSRKRRSMVASDVLTELESVINAL